MMVEVKCRECFLFLFFFVGYDIKWKGSLEVNEKGGKCSGINGTEGESSRS